MTAFADAIALQPTGEGTFDWDVPDGWQQGRGCWGGLVTGAVVEAVVSHESEPSRSVRTVSIHMSGPITVGRARIEVTPARIGSGLSTWTATIIDATGDRAVHAVVLTGRPRVPELQAAMSTWADARPPELPSWTAVPVMSADQPDVPPFVRQLEFRVVSGLPFRDGPAHCTGYVRLNDQAEWSAGDLLSIVDAWWPTAWAKVDAFRPAATITYAAHLLAEPSSVDPGLPVAFESRMSGAHEGFTTETRRIWSLDGRLLVENHQSIVMIA